MWLKEGIENIKLVILQEIHKTKIVEILNHKVCILFLKSAFGKKKLQKGKSSSNERMINYIILKVS